MVALFLLTLYINVQPHAIDVHIHVIKLNGITIYIIFEGWVYQNKAAKSSESTIIKVYALLNNILLEAEERANDPFWIELPSCSSKLSTVHC